MKDTATPEKTAFLDLAEIEERSAAKMRQIRKAHPDASLEELIRLAFPNSGPLEDAATEGSEPI